MGSIIYFGEIIVKSKKILQAPENFIAMNQSYFLGGPKGAEFKKDCCLPGLHKIPCVFRPGEISGFSLCHLLLRRNQEAKLLSITYGTTLMIRETCNREDPFAKVWFGGATVTPP
jgi:hypothetical protein